MTIQKLRMKIDFYEIKKFLRNMISIPTFFSMSTSNQFKTILWKEMYKESYGEFGD